MLLRRHYKTENPFTPAQLNPHIWLDASDLSTFVLSGIDVSEWHNKGSSTFKMIPYNGTPNRGSLGGKVGVRFAQYNTTWSLISDVILPWDWSTNPQTHFVVTYSYADSNLYQYLAGIDNQVDSLIRFVQSTGHFTLWAGGEVAIIRNFPFAVIKAGYAYTSGSGDYSSNKLVLGHRGGSSIFPWGGAIYEYLVFRDTLSANNVSKVMSYLNTKWGIT